MKNYTLLGIILFLSSYTLLSQQIINYQATIDTVYSALNTEEINTGILINKSPVRKQTLGFSETNDSISNFDKWYSIYNAIRSGSINRSGFLSYSDFRKVFKSNSSDGINPILILNYDYNLIKEYAIDSNLLDTLNGRFYNVEEAIEIPYDNAKLFSATPLFKLASNDTVDFVVNTEHYFTNDTNDVEEISINFGDGFGWRSVEFDEIVRIIYSTEGNKTIQIKITLT